MYEIRLPRHLWAFFGLLHHLHTEETQNNREGFSAVLWDGSYATTNFICLINSTKITKLLRGTIWARVSQMSSYHKAQCKTQPTSASTYKVRTFFTCIFPPFFFNLAIFLFLLYFFYTPCPVISSVSFFSGILLPSLILQLCFPLSCSSLVLSNYIFLSSERLWCCPPMLLDSTSSSPNSLICLSEFDL